MSAINGHSPRTAGPAHNLDAEKSVLGAVLLDQRHLDSLHTDEHLRPEHFYREQLGFVFGAMLALQSAGRKIDHLTVADALRDRGQLDQVGGQTAVEELVAWVPASGHAREYGRIVRNLALARSLMTATYEIQADVAERPGAGDELLEHAERHIFALRAGQELANVTTLAAAAAEEVDRLDEASRAGRTVPGLTSSLPGLDKMLGGFAGGRLYVLAARPSMGKSLLAGQISLHVAGKERARVLFASLEMSAGELAQRHFVATTGVSPDKLRLGRLNADDWPPVLQSAAEAEHLPVHIVDDGGVTASSLRARARQIAVRHGKLGLIVVDHLTLMAGTDKRMGAYDRVSENSRALKILARELDVPVIVVAQLNRGVEARPDKRPLLSDLRESGRVEEDADVVLMLYRDEYYTGNDSERPGETDLLIRKNRHGQLGTVTTQVDNRLRHQPDVEATP